MNEPRPDPWTRWRWALKGRVREALHRAVGRSGLAVRGRALARRRGIVLCYHTVDDRSVPANPNNVLAGTEFRRQLESIRACGRPVVPLESLADGTVQNGVTLTFDDGYRGCLDTVAPLLERHGLPATFFVCPGFVDAGMGKWDDLLRVGMERFDKRILRRPRAEVDPAVATVVSRRPELSRACAEALLGWKGLRELVRRGFSVQSHTMHHDFLASQSPERQRSELTVSRERLEAALGTSVDYVAYPFGFPGCHDAVTRRLARESGYTAAFALGNRYLSATCDRMALPRFGISRETPRWRLELILSGWHA